MLNPIEQFRENITRIRDLGGVYTTFSNVTTAVVDLTDLLRAQIVMIVSAHDLYVHEITRAGMLEIYNGNRPQTDSFLRFQVTLGTAIDGIANPTVSDWLDIEIRERHSHLSFQVSSCELWPSVARELHIDVQDVKNRVRAIVKRRNQIVHEADLDPTYPGTIIRRSITPADVTSTVDFIQDVCEAIDTISSQT